MAASPISTDELSSLMQTYSLLNVRCIVDLSCCGLLVNFRFFSREVELLPRSRQLTRKQQARRQAVRRGRNQPLVRRKPLQARRARRLRLQQTSLVPSALTR